MIYTSGSVGKVRALTQGNGGGGGGVEIRARGQRCIGRVQSAEGAVGAM